MNNFAKVLLGLTLSGCVVSAFGQSCSANDAYGASPQSRTGINLCSATDQIAATCANGTTLVTAPDYIYSVNLAASSNAVFTVSSATFDPYIALMAPGTGCNSNNTCGAYENLGTAGGGAVSLPTTSGLSAGTYWLVISAVTGAADCSGSPTPSLPFDLSSTGPLPVKLQNFSVN